MEVTAVTHTLPTTHPPGDRGSPSADPVLARLAILERIARGAYAEGRIDADAHDLAVRYCTVVRAVLPRLSGWGAARAGLLQATDQAVALLARFMRVPAAKTGEAADAWLPQPTVAGILVGGLEVLAKYAESLDAAVTDADVARLLELQRAVDLAFGPGFRPAHGIGDPASVPPAPEPEPEPRPSWSDELLGFLLSVPAEAWATVLMVVVTLATVLIWSPR
jgi:hypothetical protein